MSSIREMLPGGSLRTTLSPPKNAASDTEAPALPEQAGAAPSVPIPVLVLGRGLTMLGVMRSLGRARVPMYTICDTQDFTSLSRWYREAPPTGSAHVGPQQLANFLRDLPLSRGVLMPCTDDWVRAVAELPPALLARFPCSMPNRDTLAKFLDKWEFAQLLQAGGIPHPRTSLLRSQEELESLSADQLRGTILKPLSSVDFGRKHGVKGYLANNREEAIQFGQRVEFPIMLQEYIPGPPSAGYFVDGFVDRHGRIRARFARRRLRMYPRHLGNSSLMLSVSVSDVAPAVESLDRLLYLTSYRGIFSAEFKFDARDQLFKILEINARPWWYVEFAARCGVDVCGMAYQDALRLPVTSSSDYKVGRRCVFLIQDYRGRRARPREGPAGFWSWICSCFGAHDALFSWDDPRPAMSEAVRLFASRRGRIQTTATHGSK